MLALTLLLINNEIIVETVVVLSLIQDQSDR